jgi:metal transporter CNNM
MTPFHDVVTLSADEIMDHKKVDMMWVLVFLAWVIRGRHGGLIVCVFSLTSGYSRFPVHEPGKPQSFIGLLLIKKVSICALSMSHLKMCMTSYSY